MYKSRRRPWVKLYCREWLTSTVRFGLSESDRSRFIDLLALAGDSKIPGVVCAGYEQGKPSGYPLDWLASTMRCEVDELRKSLEKFVKSDRVSITGPSEQPIIRISAWNKYQSEYLRQIEAVKNRKSPKTSPQLVEQSSVTSTQLPQTEGEVEVDIEEEREVEKPPCNPGLVFKELKKIYRRAIGKSLGSPGAKGRDFAELLEKHGEEVVSNCFLKWVEEADRNFLRSAHWPFAVFMKKASELIEELADEKENGAKDETPQYPKLKPRV